MEYFKELYKEKHCTDYDKLFKDKVERDLLHMEMKSHQRHNHVTTEPFTVDEVGKLCTSLKCHKAAGWDLISPEHITFGGSRLFQVLTALMNAMLHREKLPRQFKKGIIIPIPKGKKDPIIKDNNRGITLLPIMAKIYEKALLNRHLP
jgi:hypothetical protein